ncbi:hypothetical protein GCM10027597_50770 [Saccharopolyspora tripterygii]
MLSFPESNMTDRRERGNHVIRAGIWVPGRLRLMCCREARGGYSPTQHGKKRRVGPYRTGWARPHTRT